MGGAQRHGSQADNQELYPGRYQGKDGKVDGEKQERRPNPDPETSVRGYWIGFSPDSQQLQ